MADTNTKAKAPAKSTRAKSAVQTAQSTEQKLIQLLADTPVQIFPYSRLSHTELNTRVIPIPIRKWRKWQTLSKQWVFCKT
jgi:ParB family chromosome partitioning protein